MSSSTLNKASVEKSLNSELLFLFSRTRLHSSSLMLQSMNSKQNSKLTKSQLKPGLVLLLQLTSLSQLDQLVWIPLKLTSSTPWTSRPRLTRVKSKLPRISRSAPRERKSKLLKLLSSRSSILNHSSMVSNSELSMTMVQFSQRKSSTSTQHLFLTKFKMVSETSPVFPWLLDIQLKLPFHSSLPTVSETLPLSQSNQGTIFHLFRFKIPELDALAASSAPVKEEKKEEKK